MRSSVGVELSDPDVKKVMCNVLVVEEVKEYQDKLIANCSDLDNCGLMVDKDVRLGRDNRVRSVRHRLKKTEFERPIT